MDEHFNSVQHSVHCVEECYGGEMEDDQWMQAAIEQDAREQMEWHERNLLLSQCTPWSGHLDKDGYGISKVGGKTRRMHRVAYCEHHRIPLESIAGMEVMHRCDNRACVNPNHLELGTHAQNMIDMASKGRTVPNKGERNGRSKLTESQVRAMRNEYIPRSREHGIEALASKYKISKVMVSRIVRNVYWSHVK